MADTTYTTQRDHAATVRVHQPTDDDEELVDELERLTNEGYEMKGVARLSDDPNTSWMFFQRP